MNDAPNTPPPMPQMPSPRPPSPSHLALTPMEGPGLSPGRTLEALLKRPGQILYEATLGEHGTRVRWSLLAVALICLTAFGLVIGSFSGGDQWWAAPVKLAAGMVLSGLLCLPSLYIFLCLGGLEARFSGVAGLLAAAIALAALLLVGFAPVLWIFCQSTTSPAFIGGLALVFWLIALKFGLSLLSRGATALGMQGGAMLMIWTLIFLLVTVQMTTSLRPLVGKADTFLPTEKKFFLQHWASQIDAAD